MNGEARRLVAGEDVLVLVDDGEILADGGATA